MTDANVTGLERFRRRAGWVMAQVIFGASIFVLTKAHYTRPDPKPPQLPPPAASAAARPSAPAAPPVAQQPAPQTTTPSPELAQQSVSALRERAAQQFQSQNFAAAVGTYAELVRRDPRSPDLLNNYALVLHYTKRTEEALRHLRTALNLNPNHQRSWLTLGFVHKGLGRTADAREALTRAMQLDDTSPIGTEAKRILETL